MKTQYLREVLLAFAIIILTTNLTLTAFPSSEGSVEEPGPGEGYATIYVSPVYVNLASPPYHTGDKFSVEVRISNYSQVASWQVKLVYDKGLINVSSTAEASYASDFVFPQDQYAPVLADVVDFNTTHWYVMMTSAALGAVEYSGTDAGLMVMNFTITAEPAPWQILSCVFWLEPVDTWTCDENVEENDETRIDGYYEIAVPRQVEPGPGGGYATIYVSPVFLNLTSPPYDVGDKFSVEVRIFNYSRVAGWQVKLVFDKSFLNVSSTADVSYASAHIFPSGTYSAIAPSIGYLNATHQYVMMKASSQGALEYNGTHGGLMVINFTIISAPPKGVNASYVLWLEPVETYTLDGMKKENSEERIDGYCRITVEKQETTPTEVIIALIIIVVAAAILGLFLIKRRKKAYGKR